MQAIVVEVLIRMKKEKNHFSLSVVGLMSPYPTFFVIFNNEMIHTVVQVTIVKYKAVTKSTFIQREQDKVPTDNIQSKAYTSAETRQKVNPDFSSNLSPREISLSSFERT